ncbi:MAG: zinc carboxypeptidase, partial [Pedobacter sp.]|nr:zinc carboxypeptidase [Pedobacter sp.]
MQLNGFTQKIQSPSEFLGYRLGDQFTPHYRVVEYYKYLASVSKNIKLQDYGKTNEGRPLFLAFVGSDSNISRLEEIRKNNLSLTGIKDGLNTSKPLEGLKDQPVLVWFSYNVHGNESVSTEASLQTVFDLLDPANARTKAWLKNT